MNEEILNLLKAISNDVSTFRTETIKRFDRIEDNVTELKGDVSELKVSVGQVETKVDQIEKKVDRLEVKVDQVETKVDQVEKKVDQVEKKVDRLEKKVDRVEQQGAAIGFELKDDVKKANGRISQFEPEVLTARVESVKNRNDIEDLKERVAALEAV